MRSVSFDNPWLLLAAVPLAIVILLPYVWAIRKENKTKATVASLILHTVIVAVLTMALAGTTMTTYMTKTEVVYVADVSFSTNKSLQLIDDHIARLEKTLPNNTKSGLVCFGKEYKLVADIGEKIPSVQGTGIDNSATDISSALNYASTLFSTDTIKHIVLLTDGNETDPNAANNLVRAVESLYAKNIYIDVVYINSNIQENETEVQLSSVTASAATYLNHKAQVKAVLQSGTEMQATVALYKNGEIYGTPRQLTLAPGYTTLNFDLDTQEVGSFDYEVRVEAADDLSQYNNSCSFTQSVTGVLNILLISNNEADAEALQTLYGADTLVDSYINQPRVPCTVEQLCKYDEIIISGVDVSTLENNISFVDSLDKVVSVFGKSLINIGNSNIQSSTEDVVKNYEGILPVRYGNSNDDAKLYVIVLDTSRSMNFNLKFSYAKLVAQNLLNVLNDNDEVMVVGFSGSPKLVYALTEASNRTLLNRTISELTVTQGTVLSAALEAAYGFIKDMPHENKQVMLISDGLSYSLDGDLPTQTAAKMRADGIVVSTVNPGEPNGVEMMESIASAGGGDAFYVKDNASASDVVYKQIGDELNKTVIEENVPVGIVSLFDQTMLGLNSIPNVQGYVQTKAKSGTTVVLTVPYQKSSGAVADVPLYAYWQYGEGKVSCFTSDLLGKWSGSWKGTNGEIFLRNALQCSVPGERVDYPYTLNVEFDGAQSLVEVMPVTIDPYATLDMTITMPDGSVVTKTLNFDQTRYYYEFNTPLLGKYEVQIEYSYGQETYVNTAVFHIDRSPEYDSFVLYSAATMTSAVRDRGKVYEDDSLKVENNVDEVSTYVVDFTIPLLVLAVSLYLIDIIIRKLTWADIRSLFKKTSVPTSGTQKGG